MAPDGHDVAWRNVGVWPYCDGGCSHWVVSVRLRLSSAKGDFLIIVASVFTPRGLFSYQIIGKKLAVADGVSVHISTGTSMNRWSLLLRLVEAFVFVFLKFLLGGHWTLWTISAYTCPSACLMNVKLSSLSCLWLSHPCQHQNKVTINKNWQKRPTGLLKLRNGLVFTFSTSSFWIAGLCLRSLFLLYGST